MMETWDLRLGEERPVKLPVLDPPSAWTAEVAGMQSAIRVTKLWASDPFPEDEDPDASPPERFMVFTVRATAPGRASVRFTPSGPGPQPEPRVIDVSVTG